MFSESLSFTFVMDLYRIKCGAEGRDDKNALESLKEHYPELFSDEFQEFIQTLKITAEYLGEKCGQEFSSMFETQNVLSVRKLN